MENEDEWNELDAAAEKNLTALGLKVFHDYKALLKESGHEWEGDARDILAGYIWDDSEGA